MKQKAIYIMGFLFILLFITSCSLKTDNYENAKIYTTVYPIRYLVREIYPNTATIDSIYPQDCIISEYKLNDKKIEEYSSSDFFIYNGLSSENNIAKTLIDKNNDLIIINVSLGLTEKNKDFELWLSPNNYLMLAKNIKNSLISNIDNISVITTINDRFNVLEKKLSLLEAQLNQMASDSIQAEKNVIFASNKGFKYLETYGFSVLTLEDDEYQTEEGIEALKAKYKNKTYKYMLVADIDSENEVIKTIIKDYKPEIITVNTLTLSNEDYFNEINAYLEALKAQVN